MEMDQLWEDWVNLILGVAVLVSPAFLAIDPNGAIAWNAYICGGVITLIAIFGLASPQQWEEWTNLVVGAWLFIAPFGMGFSQSNAGITMMTLGILVVAFAIWGLVDLTQRRAHPA